MCEVKNRYWLEVRSEGSMSEAEWAKLLMLLDHLLSHSPGNLRSFICEELPGEDMTKMMDFVKGIAEKDCLQNFPPDCQCSSCRAKRLVPKASVAEEDDNDA